MAAGFKSIRELKRSIPKKPRTVANFRGKWCADAGCRNSRGGAVEEEEGMAFVGSSRQCSVDATRDKSDKFGSEICLGATVAAPKCPHVRQVRRDGGATGNGGLQS